MENKMLELLMTRRSVRSYKPDQITEEELDAVTKAGTYAPTGMGMQSPVIVAVQSPKYREAVMKLNQQARGGETDPYYGAPTILVVLADPQRGTCVEDGACVLCTMMDAAHAIGLASCWIHGEHEMFQLPEGKALLREWGLPENLRGVGSLALGYAAGPLPQPKARKADYVKKV
ncbi:MAG: nitroreductase family protein [Acutalibacter sp.]|jgi:nitroreductase